MIGASAGIQRRAVSPITLGLAQDSGWYEPNWDAVGFLRHGHNAGCEMLVWSLDPSMHCKEVCSTLSSLMPRSHDWMNHQIAVRYSSIAGVVCRFHMSVKVEPVKVTIVKSVCSGGVLVAVHTVATLV